MKPEPLCGIFAKTKRSVTQINDLNNRNNAFFQSGPYEIRADLNPEGAQQVWRFQLTSKIPEDIPVIIGEILHNIRSPLDQILCAIALKHGMPEEGISFPRGRTPDQFQAVLAKQKKLLPSDAIELIVATKPYRDGGNKLLWALLELNRRDKHRVGLIPINMPAETKASYICFWKGLPLVVGCKTGQHLVMNKQFTPEDLVETGKPLALYDARPGTIVFGDASTPGDDSLEFMTTTPGAKFDADFQPSLNIAFSEVGLEGEPVIAALKGMRDLVERHLLTFEKRFFS